MLWSVIPCILRYRTNQYLMNDKVSPLIFFYLSVHKCPVLHLQSSGLSWFQGVAKQEAGRESHQLERNAGFGAAVSQSTAIEIVFEIQLQAVTHKQCQSGSINADRLLNAMDIPVCTFFHRNPVWMMEPKGFPSMSESNSIPLCFIAYDSEKKPGLFPSCPQGTGPREKPDCGVS